MLTSYITATQNLLQSPGAPTSLYSTSNITLWVNTARGQLAGESESVRYLGTISTVVGQRNYNFSAINTGASATNGIQGPIHVRRIMYNVGNGQQWMAPRSWPWFDLYHLNNPVPVNDTPSVWAQYAQGAGGSFYLDPAPDDTYTLNCDLVCYPIPLVDDTTVEAIPYLWTDAIPYYAAYLALLSSQTSARQADAKRMFDMFTMFTQRARDFSNPDVNKGMYSQAGDPTAANRLGVKVGGG